MGILGASVAIVLMIVACGRSADAIVVPRLGRTSESVSAAVPKRVVAEVAFTSGDTSRGTLIEVGFAALLVLAIGWLVGFVPGGDGGLGDGDRGDRNSGCCG
jgi:hypothetical protein